MAITRFSGPIDSENGFSVNGVTVIDQNGKIIESAGIQIADGDTFDDTNGNEVLGFTVVGSAVNYLDISNAATGTPVVLAVAGSDSEKQLVLQADGTTPGLFGVVVRNSDAGATGSILAIDHNSASPANDDQVAVTIYSGRNDAAEFVIYGNINVTANNVADGSEDGAVALKACVAGEQFVDFITLNDANFPGLVKLERGVAAATENIEAGTGGAIPLTAPSVTLNTDAGGDAYTLADGVDGQRITLKLLVDGGGDAVITPANFANGTTITFDDAGESWVGEFTSGIGWVTVGGYNYAIA